MLALGSRTMLRGVMKVRYGEAALQQIRTWAMTVSVAKGPLIGLFHAPPKRSILAYANTVARKSVVIGPYLLFRSWRCREAALAKAAAQRNRPTSTKTV